METAGGMAGPAVPFGLCYGKEAGCDIIFLAGRDDDIWRLPAHRFHLTKVHPVFKAMLSPPYVLQDSPLPYTIPIDDVEGRALDNLLRFLYNEPVPLQSIETALVTLYASHKYLCSGLARVCISYLSDNLNQANVLTILKWITIFCGDYHQNLENLAKEKVIKELSKHFATSGHELVAPSAPRYHDINENCESLSDESSKVKGSKKKPKASDAPPIVFEDKENQNLEFISNLPEDVGVDHFVDFHHTEIVNIQEECTTLLHKCLLFVDQSAETILSSDEFEDLNDTTIRLILERDTLNVKSEMIVFSAMMSWADKECKRKQLPLIPASKRQVLAESIFLPRYLTMSLSEFQSNDGPAKSGILTNEEITVFVKILTENTGSMSSPKKAQLDSDPMKRLIELSCITPITVRPFVTKLMSPRTPINSKHISMTSKLPRKNRRAPLIQSWMCFKNCCKLVRSSSPANSNPSSPVRSLHGCKNHQNGRVDQENCVPCRNKVGRNEQLGNNPSKSCSTPVPSSFDVAIERLFICWAFFFD